MFNFFVDETDRIETGFLIKGNDYNHVKNVLRMRVGEQFLVSCNGINNLCKIEEFGDQTVKVKIIKENYSDTALPIEIHLFQGLPKSDKMELIIQKTVELGVSEIIPVEMSRSIVKLDAKKQDGKISRWQAIAESAAKQSKCSKIATVNPVINYKVALEKLKTLDLILLPYECENGMQAMKGALKKIQRGMKIGIVIGPEGGFEQREVDNAKEIGAIPISLGKRILRTETASIASVAMVMLYAETEL